MKKCIDHLNNGAYKLLKKDTTNKIKAKLLKKLKALKGNEFTDNKLYCYLKPTDQSLPRFYGQLKVRTVGVPIHPIVSCSGSPLCSLNKYCTQLTFSKLMLKMKISTLIILQHFPTTSGMFL